MGSGGALRGGLARRVIQCRAATVIANELSANELTAQHSNTWLVLAVAAAACFRNPSPSPAPHV